jgi:surfeit locus 1 family protein
MTANARPMTIFMRANYSTPTGSAPDRPARPLLILLAALLVCGVTARLGVWQLDRGDQKSHLQAQISERQQLPALQQAELARDADSAAGQFNRRVQLRGHWLAQGTVFLDNRQMHGRPGFFVLTPLLLGNGDAVMVQRGWVPRDGLDRTRLPAIATPDGVQTLHGRMAPPPARLYDFGDAGSGPIRQNLDLAAHAGSLGLRLRPWSVLQTDPVAASESPLQRDWPGPALDVQKHLGYATQWFALSALTAGLYVWFQLIRPRLRRRTSAAH